MTLLEAYCVGYLGGMSGALTVVALISASTWLRRRAARNRGRDDGCL